MLPLMLSGCTVGSLSNPFNKNDSADAPPLPPSTLPPSATGATAGPPPMAPVAGPAPVAPVGAVNPGLANLPSGNAAHCPEVVAWPQDRLLTRYQSGHQGESGSVIHRAELTKLSRECQLQGNRMSVRYGLAGRVLLGPKGRPGGVSVPVSIRVAGPSQRMISSNALRVSSSIPSGQTVGYFTLVREVSFPVATGTRPEDYKIYVGLKQG